MRAAGDRPPPFADLLRHARRAAGLTQEELAEQSGLSVRGISDLERGVRRAPRRETLDLLAEALQLTEAERLEWRHARRRPTAQLEVSMAPVPRTSALVGRGREVERLHEALEHGKSSQGQVVMIAGEPGIGKTSLAEDVAAIARNQDVWVLWGRCHEGDGAPAYWPWLQIIRACVHAAAPDVLRRDLGSGASSIAQLVAEVEDKLPALAPSRPISPEQARFHLFDSITRFLQRVSLRVPLLLILDDLHWADQSSLDLLSFVGREIETSRIVVLGAYRDTELDHAPQLVQIRAVLNRCPYFQHLALSGLGEVDVGRLIERVLNHPPGDEVISAIYERTEGNPFFVGEVARLVADEGLTYTSARDGIITSIPPAVKDVLQQRFSRLSNNCRATLSAAAVAGREFTLGILEALTVHTRQHLLTELDDALRARLIERTAGTVGRYRFSHALVRETLYEALPQAQRSYLHQRAGEVLERAHAGQLGPHLTILAHHFFEGIPGGTVDKAIDYSIRAGERAASQFAHAHAIDHYRKALEALDLQMPVDDALRCDVLLRLGAACNDDGRYLEAQEAFADAAGIARELELPEHLARAAVGAAGLGVIEHGSQEHVRLLEDAATVLPPEDSLLRSRVLARLSIVLQGPDTLERRWSLIAESEAIARRLNDPSALVYALLAKHRSLWAPRFHSERLVLASHFVTLVDQVAEKSLVPPAQSYRLYDLLEAGDMPPIDPLIETFSNLTRELRQPQRQWIATNFQAVRAMMDGRFDTAEQLVNQARSIGQAAAPTLAAVDHCMFMFFLYRERGCLDQIEASAHQVSARFPNDLFWQSILTVLACELQRTQEARLSVDDLISSIERDSQHDGNAIVAAALLSTTREIDHHPQRAVRLYEVLSPYAQLNAVVPNSRHYYCLGSVSFSLGRLARVLGQWDAAERHFEDAIQMHSHMSARPYLAHGRYALAEMLVARDGSCVNDRARQLTDQALDYAEDLGMSVLAQQARDLRDVLSSTPSQCLPRVEPR